MSVNVGAWLPFDAFRVVTGPLLPSVSLRRRTSVAKNKPRAISLHIRATRIPPSATRRARPPARVAEKVVKQVQQARVDKAKQVLRVRQVRVVKAAQAGQAASKDARRAL